MLKPVIYQLVVRYFSNTTLLNKRDGTIGENGCGKFNDINEAALRGLKALGCTHIWLTGCVRQATLTGYPEIGLPADDADIVKGLAGSMYSIRDYYDVCPDYAYKPEQRMQEFESLVQRIHDAGMKALIDFVPNHVARSYASVVHPDRDFGRLDDQSKFYSPENNFFYVTDPPHQKLQLVHPEHWNPVGITFDGTFERENGSDGRTVKVTGDNISNAKPPVDSWYEVIKLNYGFNFVTRESSYDPIPRTWTDMDEVIRFWQSKKVDGFRCDFAHYVPGEAWKFLIDRARSAQRDSACYFLAEAYPWAGSGDPITAYEQLIDAGFDSIYHGESYQALRKIYHGQSSPADYDVVMTSRSEKERSHSINYIENHDEVRAAAPLEKAGFGSMKANYQLMPLQCLYGSGAVMLLNGQEVGEPGAGDKGYGGEDGRTTIFDYWCMPEMSKWVNKHAYDGQMLTEEQIALRRFLSDLFALCQDPAITASGYWGLKYWNRQSKFADCPDDLYSFARYAPFSSRLVIVVANFDGEKTVTGQIRIPAELASDAHLNIGARVKLLLDQKGRSDRLMVETTRDELIKNGFLVALPPQSSHVFSIE